MICKICKIDKPATDFYKRIRTQCKKCFLIKQKIHRASPAYREMSKAYFAKWKAKNSFWRNSYITEASYKWKQDHPDGMKAHLKISYALRAGNIKKPLLCSNCHKQKRLSAHHDDYSKPLDVKWLCWSCHRLVHSV